MSSKSGVGARARRTSLMPLIDGLARYYEHDAERPISGAAYRAGALVRMMRKSNGLSQAELGKRIGVSQARISEIETGIGVQGPTWDLMERIAAACDAAILFRTHASEIFGAADVDLAGPVAAEDWAADVAEPEWRR